MGTGTERQSKRLRPVWKEAGSLSLWYFLYSRVHSSPTTGLDFSPGYIGIAWTFRNSSCKQRYQSAVIFISLGLTWRSDVEVWREPLLLKRYCENWRLRYQPAKAEEDLGRCPGVRHWMHTVRNEVGYPQDRQIDVIQWGGHNITLYSKIRSDLQNSAFSRQLQSVAKKAQFRKI